MKRRSPKEQQARPGAAAVKMDAIVAAPDGTIPVDAIVADKARELEELYRKYGDERFRAAAHALVKPPPHRPPEDHNLNLAIMRVLTSGPNAMEGMAAARKVGEAYPAKDRRQVVKRIWEQFQRHGRS